MELVELGTLELTYRFLERIDYAAGGQFYGVLEGALSGDRLSGALHLTNLAQRRPDGVNTPTMRGILTTDDGDQVWVMLDGLAILRPEDSARVFVTSARLRAGSERLAWVNTVLGVVEGVLDTVVDPMVAHARLYECRPTLA